MKHGYLLFYASLFLYSCSRENLSNNIPSNINTELQLKNFVILDTTKTAPNDTLETYSFRYDALNRCVQIERSQRGINYITYTNYFYNGTDTLISKINHLYAPGQSYDSSFEYLTYNINGQLIKDSVIIYSGPRVLSSLVNAYQIQGDSIISNVSSIVNGTPEPYIKGIYILNRGFLGNIVYERDTMNIYGGFSFNTSLSYTIVYDNSIDPFFKLYPKRLVENNFGSVHLDEMPLYFSIFQSNNILSERRNALSSGSQDVDFVTYNYQYNSSNYPVTVLVTNILSGRKYKGLFYY